MNDTLGQSEIAAELTEALGYFDRMFAHSRDVAIAFDREARILRWNTTAEWLTKRPSLTAVGAAMQTLYPPLCNHQEWECFERALGGQYAEVAQSTWSGVHTVYAPLLGRSGAVVAGYAVAKIADDLQDTVERLSRSNAELERFAYVAAHDLQEPVRMVASYMRLLSDKLSPSLDDATRRHLEFALDGALRMRALIDGLLAVSRVQGLELEPQEKVSLDEVVSDALTLLSLAVEECAAQITKPALPSVPGQRVLLVQLFQNLLANAIKFRGSDPLRIAISCEQPTPGEYLVQVQDNGIGLPMEHAERALHLLQRIHSRKRYPGSGIGLTLCKEVVAVHGGRIWLDSEVGVGTRVSFTLKS